MTHWMQARAAVRWLRARERWAEAVLADCADADLGRAAADLVGAAVNSAVLQRQLTALV